MIQNPKNKGYQTGRGKFFFTVLNTPFFHSLAE